MATKKAEGADAAPVTITYLDKCYSQRTVHTGSMRTLRVVGARVEVKSDDEEALAFLDQHAEFERLE
ncbi:hypothetical protein V0R55_24600 [Pseudomonas soli]|uniref:Uncharacterized protein n=1 Tax=Pseudomonas soli TaxID=1306993 RepID=A0ABU7GWA7_9PSED|nr:hypothetical protein [Pseudomonas soli]MEE1883348.1 hypothetical protein [Pseudomonas soli]